METQLCRLAVFSMSIMVSVASGGCGYSPLTTRDDNPIIVDKLNSASWLYAADLGTVATKADRRLALIRVGISPGMDIERMPVGFICAEPPPDIAESTAQLITAAASAGDDKRQISAGYLNEEAVVAALLLNRSQGVQFARDSFFQLCLARMNGVIMDEDWRHLLLQIINGAKFLIGEEIRNDSKLSELNEVQRAVITGATVDLPIEDSEDRE